MLDTLEPRRLLSAGFPDVTFGNGGVVTPAAHLPFEPIVGDVAVDDRGRTVVAGGHGDDALLMRLNPDGSLDRTFSRDGIYQVDFGSLREFVTGVELLPDGRILALVDNISGVQTLMRLRGDGTPDPTFGRGGAVQATFIPGLLPFGLAVQDDDKILLAGERQVQRFRTNGAPDRSFGLAGIWRLSHTSFDSMFIRDVRQVAGGKIMLAGEGTGPDGN